MPTRAPERNPFAPESTPSREELLAYAEGRLPPDRQHEVESWIEADSLVADAVEGLKAQGAAVRQLDSLRPRNRNWTPWWISGALVIIAALAFVPWSKEDGSPALPPDKDGAFVAGNEPVAIASEDFSEEVAVAQEQPESLRIGHEQLALHTRDGAEPRLVRDSLDRVQPRSTQLKPRDAPSGPSNARRARSSRQLIFLHDMKLVHPKELYANDPVMRLAEAGVLARFADRQEQGRASSETMLLPYTAFMDDAIGRFANGDHKATLDDLRFVLGQYPDDVNALFYAGLCAHNIGLHERARQLLHRAATHPVDVFDEEAAWYHALTLERLGDRAATQEAFVRIAAADGFYAGAARARLSKWME
jgi:hypothetical protein